MHRSRRQSMTEQSCTQTPAMPSKTCLIAGDWGWILFMAEEPPRSSTETSTEEPMSQQLFFSGVYPIGDTDTKALPVKELGPAIGYYTQVLGFSVVSKEGKTAVLRRDDTTIGLAVNGQDPEQA